VYGLEWVTQSYRNFRPPPPFPFPGEGGVGRGARCQLSICADVAAIVRQSASAVLSHKQQSADLGKVLVVVYNRRWSD